MSDQPLMIPDTSLDARVCDNPFVIADPNIGSYLGIPLVTRDGYALGSICAMDVNARIYSASEVETMRNLASLVVDWLEMRRMATSDFLTGAMTRRSLVSEMEREILRYTRYQRPCAIAILDLDRFKLVNDTHGHPVGDVLLKAVSAVCHATLRSGDMFGRLGGEEFGLLLPETDTDEAFRTAERFREAIEQIRLADHPELRASASFGVAPFSLAYKNPEQWIAAADGELYRAKREGRNRCCLKAA
jgi:diguanylate cyclase (GGDEF)-like protein